MSRSDLSLRLTNLIREIDSFEDGGLDDLRTAIEELERVAYSMGVSADNLHYVNGVSANKPAYYLGCALRQLSETMYDANRMIDNYKEANP